MKSIQEFVNEQKATIVRCEFSSDIKNISKELTKRGVSNKIVSKDQEIEIEHSDAERADKILKKINAWDEDYNFSNALVHTLE